MEVDGLIYSICIKTHYPSNCEGGSLQRFEPQVITVISVPIPKRSSWLRVNCNED